MDENEFEFDGKVYVAIENNSSKCDGCALDAETDVGYCLDINQEHPCLAMDRKDRRNVIFLEKQQ